MAITSVTIVQDNIVGGCDLLAVHSPLKFLAEITDNDSPYSFPEYLNVEVTDLLTATTYTGYKAWQYEKVSDKARFIFNSEKILRDIMGDFSDVDGDSIDYPNFLVRQFRVKFIYLALNDYVDFFGYACSRQVGQTECVTEIASNENEIAYAFCDREMYLHYYVGGVSDDIIFDGYPCDSGGMVRLRKTPTTVGIENIEVYRLSSIVLTPVYGYLYNRLAVLDSGKFIPTAMVTAGWRVPSSTDITNLKVYANSDVLKLKSCRMVDNTASVECNTTVHPRWNANPTYEGTNENQFSALPNGVVNESGVFIGLGTDFYIILSDSAAGSTKIANISANTLVIVAITQYAGVGVRLVRNATTAELLLPDGKIDRTYYTGNDAKKYNCYKVGTQVWTPFLAETKLNDDTTIFLATSGQGEKWYNNIEIAERAAYDYNNAYVGSETDDYYLAKTIQLNVLPDCTNGLYVKFLDSNTGYYKHWLFSRYFEIQGENESYGTVENFSLNLLQEAELEIGKKFKRKFLISADLTQAEMDYIKGLLSSPRIYYLNENDKWISVKLYNSTNTLRYPKNNTGVQMFTLVEASQNTVTML